MREVGQGSDGIPHGLDGKAGVGTGLVDILGDSRACAQCHGIANIYMIGNPGLATDQAVVADT